MESDARREQFASLYGTCRPRLLAYALRRSSSAEDAADVVADSFIVAWRRLEDIPDGEASILWLYATARRVLANQIRRTDRYEHLVDRIGQDLATKALVDSESSEGDQFAAVTALERLSDEDRELLMLVGWEGLDSAQLAYVLGCSPIAARVRLHHARGRLSAELAELGIWTKQSRPARQLRQQRMRALSDTEEVSTK